jgi:CubicO group peptidase (beta-lactamase class C family)
MRLFVALLLVTSFAKAQSPDQYQPGDFNDPTRKQRIEAAYPVIEKLYKDYAEAHHFPGYAFGIVIDGELAYKSAGGYANLEEKIPATTASFFRIASMSKSFTSLAILHLRDQGKLRLDDPVEKYIPQMKGKGLTKDAPKITIRHLMSHSAGFPEDNPWGDRQLADTEKDLEILISKGLSFSNTPGVQYEYSNLGFAMLGYIIHKASGMYYSDYIKKYILLPLGMKGTTYEYAEIPKEKFAVGYRYIYEKWRKETPLHDGIYGSMGGMITSIDQFGKYVAMHVGAWPERNDKEGYPVKRSSIREMHDPARFITLNPNFQLPNGKQITMTSSYAYGLNWMRDTRGVVSIGHSGGLPGYGSNWRFLPEYGIGVIFFGNVTYAPTSVMNVQVIDTLITLAKLKPRLVGVSPILKKRQLELIKTIETWNQPPAVFAENFFDDYPLDLLIKQSNEVFGTAGKIISTDTMVAENQLRGYCIIHCERNNVKMSFTLSPENPALIQEYHLTLEK